MHLSSIVKSPALRGFVGERWSLATTSLYLVHFSSFAILAGNATNPGDLALPRVGARTQFFLWRSFSYGGEKFAGKKRWRDGFPSRSVAAIAVPYPSFWGCP